MRKSSGKPPTCCCPSAPQPGRICWFGRCWPSNCSGRRRSLRTIPIIAKDRVMRAVFRLAPLSAARGKRAWRRTPANPRPADQGGARGASGGGRRNGAARADRGQCPQPGRPAARPAGRGGAGDRGRRGADHIGGHAGATGLVLCRRASPPAGRRAATGVAAARRPGGHGAAAAVIVLADGGSTDELVKVRILLDSTLAHDPRPNRPPFR